MNFSQYIIKCFTPDLRLDLGGQSDVLRVGGKLGGGLSVIPRKNCSFRRVKLAGKDSKGVKAALFRYQNEFHTPGRTLITKVQKNKDYLEIWECDENIAGRKIVETMIRVPMKIGARLVSCVEGYEGQIWREYELIASRWWSAPPLSQDWNNFIIPHGDWLPLSEVDNEPFSPAFRQDWPSFGFNKDFFLGKWSVGGLFELIFVSLLCISVFTGFSILGAMRQNYQLKKELDVLSSRVESSITLRRKMLSNKTHIDLHRPIFDEPEIMAAISDLRKIISGDQIDLTSINVDQEGVRLKLSGLLVQSVPDLVTELEASEYLSAVSVTLSGEKSIDVCAEFDE